MTHPIPTPDLTVLDQSIGPNHALYHADTVELCAVLPDASIDFSIFSPPFASLYTYSNSPRDMGNVRSHGEFYEHFKHLAGSLFRVLKPGRLISVHCMNLPTSKARDGVIGISDFRGDLVRIFEYAGFVYHSEVVIWKDPVTAMQRTKALGLLHKQLKKDSAMSRQGIPDYLVNMVKPVNIAGNGVRHVSSDKNIVRALVAFLRETYALVMTPETVEPAVDRALTAMFPSGLLTFRKDGENAESIAHDDASFPVERWQRYASPVWMDINPSRTLQYTSAREEKDEKHICPLQLDVIERAVDLWTNEGDVVLSPFAGIGSEGYVSLQKGRRFVGAELKRSYYEQAARNLARAEPEAAGKQASLIAV